MNPNPPIFQSLDPVSSTASHADDRPQQPLMDHYFQLVRQNWLPILLICIASLAVGVISVFFSTRLYTAETRIEITRPRDTVTQVASVQSDQYMQNLEFYETQYSLLEAESLAERVVNTLSLAQDDSFFDMLGVDPVKEFEGIALESQQGRNIASFRRDLAAELLLEYVRVRPVEDSSLVDVLFSGPSPRQSAQIANTWVDQFIEAELERRSSNSVRAREFLELRLGELLDRLEDSERQLVQYASNRGIVTIDQQQNSDGTTRSERTIASASLESMNQSLAQATADRIAAEAVYRAGASTDAGSAANQALAQLREERALAQAEYAQLLAKFGPEYPAIQSVASRIESLDGAISSERGERTGLARADFLAAQQEEQSLREQVNALTSQAIGQRGDSIQYGIFQREVDTNRQLYDALLQRYKELGVADIARSNVSVVDRADIPDFPSSPRVPLNLGLSLLVGMALAGGFIFLKVNLDQTLKNPAQVPELLGGTLLGSIPFSTKNELIEEIRDRHSYIYEAYLSVRTNLEFLTAEGTPRSILLTSTIPNEGKSNSAVAIARILADTGKKVLLIDADMRKPSLPGLVDREVKEGLSNYLSGAEDLSALVVSSDDWDFDMLMAGPMPPNIGGMLMNKRMGALIEEAKLTYDHIVIDGPPVLGLADAPILSGYVDGLVFVVEANRTRLNATRNAIRRINQANSTIFGFVVTKLDSRNAAYGYGTGDPYGYSYGSE